ncbi:MAG: putative lipid II flippase FtsW [Defluviitaleaceae bacterium]|nr:putative lipid II flippase FtsW [Defluviitaleaceae bacterium]
MERYRDEVYDNEPRQRTAKARSRDNKRSAVAAVRQNIHIGSVDITLYLVVTILVLIGVVMVFSASYIMAANRTVFDNDMFFFLRRNGIFAIVGFIIMNLLASVSYEYIRPFVFLIYMIAVGMLIAVMIIGVASGGAVRWLPFPIIDRFQPSEVSKAALIFILAYLIEQYPNALRTWKGLFTYAGIVTVTVALVLYGGFSTALIIAAVGFGMIFIASPHFWRFIIAGGGIVVAVVSFLWIDATWMGGFRGRRFTIWQDPFSDPTGMGFQIIQSLYAVASGGWFGVGIGQSRQSSFIPEPHNDIIFAIIVEELGFIGAGLILVLFGIFIWRGILIALRARDTFSSMIAIGIVFAIGFQTIINVAVVTNSIPNTGVTLPFISYGGTSLIVSMALAGILLNISRYSKDSTAVSESASRHGRTKPKRKRNRQQELTDSD